MNQTIELVIITFKFDLPQFYLLLLSIKKYLYKDIQIKIIVNYNDQDEYNSLSAIKLLASEHLSDFSFTVLEKPLSIPANGWIGQQICKWYAAYTSTCPWQMVIDSKNFFIKEFNFLDIDFLNNNIPGFFQNENCSFLNNELEKSFNFIKEHQSILPQRYAAVTPWIWKTDLIKEMLDTLWPNLAWQKLNELPGTEWFLYISWAAGKVNYFPKQFVTGIWGGRNPADNQLYKGAFNSNICFWTKHRFALDDESINFTKKILKEFSVATDEEIKNWLRMIKDLS
jgi:hypothetical protein